MKTAEIIQFPLFSGANDVTRTHDLLITNQLLYRLSYISIFTFGVADLILTNCRTKQVEEKRAVKKTQCFLWFPAFFRTSSDEKK